MKSYCEARVDAQRRRETGEPVYRKATARDVRTGDTITNDWARINFHDLTLTVDYPTWERFTNPEGWTGDVIRFTGTDSRGRHVENGWGLRPDHRVYIIEEAPHDGDTFGELS